MKLLIAFISAFSAACFIGTAFSLQSGLRRPPADFVTKALGRLGEKLLAKTPRPLTGYVRHLAALIDETPLPQPINLPLFLALQGVAGLPLWVLAAFAMPNLSLILFPLCLCAGTALPYIWLKHHQARFHTALLKALPEYLELQALVMEAGLDLSAGIQHYLEKGTPNPLQNLLRGVQNEIQLGRSRPQALAALAQKTRFAPLRDVVRGVIQALAMGGSLAPFLREQAGALRTRRMQVAEKKAAEAPLKILFPLFVFIFPTIFIVLLGPMALLFMNGGF